MREIQQIIDERRKAEAVVYGLNLELSIALGLPEDARHWLTLMNACTTARIAVREAGCFFDEQGQIDRKKVI